MAKGNLTACLAVVFEHEGVYTDNPKDPGNWTGGKIGVGKLKGTKYGIAAASYPNLDIKGLTLDEAAAIYATSYWAKVRGDLLPYGLDLATVDPAINSGPGRAIPWLQYAVGTKVDGKLGDATIKAAVMSDVKAAIVKLCARRMSFLRGLAIWQTFKRGWTRRVADIEARGVAMWLGKGAALAPAQREELRRDAEVAGKKASGQAKAGTNTAAGGTVTVGGSGTADAVVAGDVNWLLIAGGLLLVGVIVAAFVLKSRQNNERAKAYLDAARPRLTGI